MSIELDSVGVKYAHQVTTRIRTRIASIREGVDRLEELLHEARTGNVHIAMGFTSWTAYLAYVFQDNPVMLPKPQRRELVAMLSGEGMSTRAIGTIAGVSEGTVRNDLSAQNYAPEQAEAETAPEQAEADAPEQAEAAPEQAEGEIVEAEIVEDPNPPTVTGLDGRTYAKTRPRPKRSYVAEARAAVTALREAAERLDDTRRERLSAETELRHTEDCRRAERAVGLAVRRAQDAGEVARKGDGLKQNAGIAERPSPRDFFRSSSEWTEINAMTEAVTDELFEAAIEAAKAEGNLSRRTVIQKIKNGAESNETAPAGKTRQPWSVTAERVRELAEQQITTRQIAQTLGISEAYVKRTAKEFGFEITADQAVGKTRRHDANRIVAHTVTELDGLVAGLELVEIDYAALDPDQAPGWLESLNKSIRSLNRFQREIAKIRSNQS